MVVFTAGPLLPVNRVFFERLAADPLLVLTAVIVDEYTRPRKPLPSRIIRGFRKEGWPWLWFKFTSSLASLIRKTALSFFELTHPRMGREESYDMLTSRSGIDVYRVADIHGEESLTLIKSLRPQLGVILGGRILRESVLEIPEHGTLNIHKRKVPEHRGGGPVGYWEVLAGEPSIGVTIHYATSQVDAGPVLAEATIPIEECDTLESLRIKADIAGARLYQDTIRRVALGHRQGIPQDASRVTTHRAPSELQICQLQRRLEQKSANKMPCGQFRPSWAVRARVLLQYVLVLPLLLCLRNWLLKRHQAPICIFFYHVVANRPVNHMCLPLEEFVKQMEFLSRYYEVVSLDEAVERLRSGKNDKIAAAITFDDGYRDNTWAIEYLQYFGIPASFFVSMGHVRDGTPFEHDLQRGFRGASPMREAEVRRLAVEGFLIGSHAIYHEDFGALDRAAADVVLRESRLLIGHVAGQTPEHFSFPKGHKGRNITPESFGLAQQHYRYVYSAYGGYNFPGIDRRHFLRIGNPTDVLTLAMTMDGYTGFRQCVTGNAWGLKVGDLPY